MVVLSGPPCSLFVFLSSSFHRRSNLRPLGATDRWKVRLSNLIVSNMCVAMKLVLPRTIYIIIEQPKSPFMFPHPAMTMLQAASEQEWVTIPTFMGKFQHAMPKPSLLLTNMRTARLLQRSMNFNDFRKLKQQATASNQVFVRYTPAGPAGGRDLHESAKCTRCFL